jgi:hypothetical protein
MDDRISAAARISASQSDVTGKKMFHSLPSKENETWADIFSRIKCFCYALERKQFCRRLLVKVFHLTVMLPTIKDEPRPEFGQSCNVQY